MGVEFRLGRQDGRKAEDFLARRPAGVSAITLDTVYARYQHDAADAARAIGARVFYDPATERMADPGFTPAGVDFFHGDPFDVQALAVDPSARARLVDGVLAAHPDVITDVTPPHFYVHDDRTAALNVALAEHTAQQSDKPTRAVLVIARKYAEANARRLADEYRDASITAVELRVTPLGGDDESVAKIRSVFAIADAFIGTGIEVVLGQSGNIGHTAVALGHAVHYSVGVGLRERVDHAAAISRQRAPEKTGDGDEQGNRFGATAGIYLPGPAATVGRRAGASLLSNTDIRTRIGCRVGACGQSVSGPAADPREHYLHARASEMATMLGKPAPWRATGEIDRLRRAAELRDLINSRYLTKEVRPLKTRTLRSLIDDIEGERAETA